MSWNHWDSVGTCKSSMFRGQKSFLSGVFFRRNSLCLLRSTVRIPGCAISVASNPTAGRKTTSDNCFCRNNTAAPSPPCSAPRSSHSARHPCCTDTEGWRPGRSRRRAKTGPGRRARAPACTGTGISRPQSFSDTYRS